MAAYTKTQGDVILSHQAVTHPNKVVSSVQTLSTELSATIVMYHALIEATANTNPGYFDVQISPVSSGDEDWATVERHYTFSGTPASENVTTTETDDSIAVASTTGFAAGDVLYIQDTTTETDSEWADCWKIVTNTSIDLVSNLTNQKDTTPLADIVWGNAQRFITRLNLDSIVRVRVVYAHGGATGANSAIKATMITGDSIG